MNGSEISQNNRRIAKNTVMLYIRMFVSMLISLYTVRVTLQVLGADDYGIYNAVGGVIGFVGFISATLTNAAQRYLAFDLGKGDEEGYNHTFSMMMIAFIAVGAIIVVIAESLGPWLIGSYLVIPSDRMAAAQWVFQISLLNLLVSFVTIPYMASIVAHEKMGFYAYLSIAEAFLKLLIVYAIMVAHFDKLVFYSFLLFLMSLIITSIYVGTCLKKFPGCSFKWYWNKPRFKEIGSYIGWNTFGSLSGTLQTQAVTMVTSVFFQPAVLASRAIADRVHNVSYSFVTNFIMASSPQMVKYYAAQDSVNFNLLFYRISKFGYYLMLVISVPLILLMPDLLSLWLSDTLLDDMVLFSRLSLVNALVSSLETPISRAISATGYVRLYQLLNCVVAFIGIPIIIFVFKSGMGAEWGYIVSIVILLMSLLYRIFVLRKYSSISIVDYLKIVVAPVTIVTLLACIVYFLLSQLQIYGIVVRILVLGLLSIGATLAVIYLCLKNSEKKYINNIIISRFHAHRK